MNNKRLSESEGPVLHARLIRGIYNYCDRWCEHCSFRSGCLLYLQEEKTRNDPEPAAEAEGFWEYFESVAGPARDLLLSSVRERDASPGIEDRRVSAAGELSRAAREYQRLAQYWLERHPEFCVPYRLEPADEKVAAVQVIQWYQFLIAAKLHRALHGRERFEREGPEAERVGKEDADGSAKVALIGIDRSIAAWALLARHYPSSSGIREIIAGLDRLRRRGEAEFPDARSFRRPGFDDAPAAQ